MTTGRPYSNAIQSNNLLVIVGTAAPPLRLPQQHHSNNITVRRGLCACVFWREREVGGESPCENMPPQQRHLRRPAPPSLPRLLLLLLLQLLLLLAAPSRAVVIEVPVTVDATQHLVSLRTHADGDNSAVAVARRFCVAAGIDREEECVQGVAQRLYTRLLDHPRCFRIPVTLDDKEYSIAVPSDIVGTTAVVETALLNFVQVHGFSPATRDVVFRALPSHIQACLSTASACPPGTRLPTGITTTSSATAVSVFESLQSRLQGCLYQTPSHDFSLLGTMDLYAWNYSYTTVPRALASMSRATHDGDGGGGGGDDDDDDDNGGDSDRSLTADEGSITPRGGRRRRNGGVGGFTGWWRRHLQWSKTRRRRRNHTVEENSYDHIRIRNYTVLTEYTWWSCRRNTCGISRGRGSNGWRLCA